MGWSRATLPLAGGSCASVAYRLSPSGPAKRLLFALHGAGNDALFGWVGLFKRQLSAGTEIFSFDLPGHGRDSIGHFHPESVVDVLRGALDACASRSRELAVHAVGVSLGGSLLLAALPVLQHRLTSAALIVAPLRIELSLRRILSEIRPANLALLWAQREHYGLTGLIPSFGPFKRDVYPLRLGNPPPAGFFGYVRALNADLEALRLEEAAGRTELPVLLAYGGRDQIVPMAQGERLAGLLTAAELVKVREGTHLSTPLAETTLEKLDGWIARW